MTFVILNKKFSVLRELKLLNQNFPPNVLFFNFFLRKIIKHPLIFLLLYEQTSQERCFHFHAKFQEFFELPAIFPRSYVNGEVKTEQRIGMHNEKSVSRPPFYRCKPDTRSLSNNTARSHTSYEEGLQTAFVIV